MDIVGPYTLAMAARIIDGVAFAERIKADAASRAREMEQAGRRAQLTALLVGSSPPAELYARRQGEGCRAVGIDYQLKTLPADADLAAVGGAIASLNGDPAVNGIMLHLPLPRHLDATAIQNLIAPAKDVEGVGAASLGYLLAGKPMLVPCTALAAFELARSTGVTLRGCQAVVIGASAIVGKPAALLLSDERATVSICRSATSNLAEYTRRADILIVAVGQAGFLKAEHVAPGAVVVDVGINRITMADGTKKTVGDVDYETVKEIAGQITPVPGGVGPVTVAMLMRNTIRAAEMQKG